MPAPRASRPRAHAVLLFAESEHNPDQLYFSRFSVPDPFIALEHRGRKIGVLNALEFGRALKESAFDDVLALEDWAGRAKKHFKVERARIAHVIATIARDRGIRRFDVPHDFPTGVAFQLQALGVKIVATDGEIFPAREIKSARETRAIIEGNRCSAVGLAAAEAILRRTRIARGKRTLLLDGRPLTSEGVKQEIEIACLHAGSVSQGTIVAGGDQACDPHCRGHGPLRAHELIIVDIFPRVTATGYHGDMTRTFLKGSPSDAQAKLVAAVASAHKKALSLVRADAHGRDVHEAVAAHFNELGFETRRGSKGSVGFFHGTGHGLGLAIHEAPGMGQAGTTLRKGTVVTVEPGLYYPGPGGCRIEDVVQVTARTPRMLSSYHTRWVID